MINIPVDLTNPGQFFACCGLFELADRIWRSSEVSAHFDSRCFVIDTTDTTASAGALLQEFSRVASEQLDQVDSVASPLRLAAPFGLRLDWWIKPEKGQSDLWGGGKLKTWAGRQLGPLIFRLMKVATSDAALTDSPLDYMKPIFDLKDGKPNGKTISPFYFDSRREGTSLDVGFSSDEQGMSVEACPAVESLGMVGLQRFRPLIDESTQPRSFVYHAWNEPLPVAVAALAVCGLVAVPSCGSFRFTRPSRGGEYTMMFSRATRERNK